MDYLQKAKQLEAEKANSERQKGRMGTPATKQDEDEAEDSFIIGPAPGPEQPAESASAPAELVQPQEQSEEAPKPKSEPKSKSDKKEKPAKKSKKASNEEAFGDKEKYGIYISPTLSLALRTVCLFQRKKISQVAEEALTCYLLNHYRCTSASCHKNFYMNSTEEKPGYCPVCGCEKVELVRIETVF